MISVNRLVASEPSWNPPTPIYRVTLKLVYNCLVDRIGTIESKTRRFTSYYDTLESALNVAKYWTRDDATETNESTIAKRVVESGKVKWVKETI